MAYRVPAAQDIGPQIYTITGVIQLMGSHNPPANIAFTGLGNPSHTRELSEGQGAAIQASTQDAVVRSVGLLSCASVCYVNSSSATGYVYHANAGHVTRSEFNSAMAAIGAKRAPYDTVFIAYAHPNKTDSGYQANIADFVNWGMPTNNIVEITNLFLNQFGMNNLFQIGY